MGTIRITGSYDNTGYGVASKATAICLINAGLDISTQVINTNMSRREFANDAMWQTIANHINSRKSKINLVQLMPKLWSYGFQKDTYNIGYMFWESDRICDEWVNIINNGLCNEVWVPCPSNYDALINSGVKKPVYIVPQHTRFALMDREHGSALLPIPNETAYKFYSIFQWSQRKNPESLLQAYFREFLGEEDTMLVIKTYGPSAFADKRWIKEAILDIKEGSGSTAPIYLFGELLTIEQINAIHAQCHCYVYSGRSEGWNIPLIESMAYKKQVITTKTGGIADWITDQSAYIIPHKKIPINTDGNVWGAYYRSNPPQNWGDVEISDVQKMMRKAYEERNDYTSRINYYDNVLSLCSEDNVLRIVKERLSKIL